MARRGWRPDIFDCEMPRALQGKEEWCLGQSDEILVKFIDGKNENDRAN